MRFFSIALFAATAAALGCPAPPPRSTSSTVYSTSTTHSTSSQSSTSSPSSTAPRSSTTSPVPLNCSTDSCLQAVKSSGSPPLSGTLDCSSYFLTRVTPIPALFWVTVPTTVTVTISKFTVGPAPTTATTTTAPPLVKRQNTIVPNSRPHYASACPNAFRYSSACSCIGVTHAITTLPVQSKTFTVTPTLRTTTTIELAPTLRPFVLQTYNQFGLYITPLFDGGQEFAGLTTELNDAQVFYIEPGTNFAYAAGYGPIYTWQKGISFVYLGKQNPAFVDVTCNVNATSYLECTSGDLSVWGIYDFPDRILMGVPGTNFDESGSGTTYLKVTYL